MTVTRANPNIIDLCSDSDDEELPKPTKRRRIHGLAASAQISPKKEGKSVPSHNDNKQRERRHFLELPFDIIVEVFAFLNPLDIIRLARTCKTFRIILLNKSNGFFWRNARKNVNTLPKCPEDMSEPSYARFMFDYTCYICSKASKSENLTTSWALRIRVCYRCFHDETYFRYGYNISLHGQKVEKELLDLVTPMHSEFYSSKYYVPYVLDVAAQYVRFGSEESNERTLWLSEQKDRQARDKKFAEDYSKWDWEWKKFLQQEMAEIQKRREQAIVGRLTDEGFGEEFNHFNERQQREFQNHPDVMIPEPLSEAAWKGMKRPLLKLMNDVRLARLAKERKNAIKARLDILQAALDRYRSKRPGEDIVPSTADIATSPQYLSLITRPTKSKVHASQFEQLFRDLPALTATWLTGVNLELQEQICEDMPSDSNWPKPIIGTAGVFFRCLSCKCIEPYPAILQHRCEGSFEKWLDECNHPPEFMTIFKHLQSAPRLELLKDQLSFHVPTFKRVHLILQACGLQTETTTEAQLDVLDPLLECTHPICTLEMDTGYRHAMRWRRAVLHSLEIDKPSWKVLSSADAKKLASLEFGSGPLKDDSCPFACSLCDYYGPATAMGMRTHMEHCHELPDTDIRSWEYHSSATFEARAREIIWFKSRKRQK